MNPSHASVEQIGTPFRPLFGEELTRFIQSGQELWRPSFRNTERAPRGMRAERQTHAAWLSINRVSRFRLTLHWRQLRLACLILQLRERSVRRSIGRGTEGIGSMADAKECRQRALRCAQLAQANECGRRRELLLDLTKTWLKLACEVERTTAPLDDDFLAMGFKRRDWSAEEPRLEMSDPRAY